MTTALLIFAFLDLMTAGVIAWKRAAVCTAAPVSKPFRMARARQVTPICFFVSR